MPSSKSSDPQSIEPSSLRQPWDRRKDETQRAFAAFCIFRDSADRKLANVAKTLTPPCSVPNVARWSGRHDWQERAVAFDIFQDGQQRVEMARSRREIRRRRLQIAHALEGLGAHALREWQERIAQKLPLNLSMETIALLSKTAAQLQEQALGPETERGAFTQINVVLGEHEYEGEEHISPAEVADGEKKLVN